MVCLLRSILVSSLAFCLLTGCSLQNKPDSEEAAKSFLDSEFKTWMGGSKSSAVLASSPIGFKAPPVGYSIKSMFPDRPHLMAFSSDRGQPKDWQTWTAYKVNVAIEFKSQAGSPLEKIATYTLTWNPHESRWFLNERF